MGMSGWETPTPAHKLHVVGNSYLQGNSYVGSNLGINTTAPSQRLHVVGTETMKLYQNAPNPFNERTTIKCYVPERIQKAQLCVYTMQGVQVQCITITERGNVEIQIEAGALSSGIYSYVLIGDGTASEAKQMILTK